MPVQLMAVKLKQYSKYATVSWQYGLDDLELDFWQGQGNLSSVQRADWLSGTPKPPLQKIQQFLIPKVQQLGCAADRSLAPNAQVKNQFSSTCTTLHALCHAQAQLHRYTVHIQQVSESNR
jgi:hypothetical protein